MEHKEEKHMMPGGHMMLNKEMGKGMIGEKGKIKKSVFKRFLKNKGRQV